MTPTGRPFVVEYSAADSAGNEAVPALRRVFVVNPCAPNAVCAITGGKNIGRVGVIQVLTASLH